MSEQIMAALIGVCGAVGCIFLADHLARLRKVWADKREEQKALGKSLMQGFSI